MNCFISFVLLWPLQRILQEVFSEVTPSEPAAAAALKRQTSAVPREQQSSCDDHASTSSQIIDEPPLVDSSSSTATTDVAQLRRAVVAAGEKRGLEMTDYFVGKVIELWQALGRRHGVIVAGEPMSGKTEAREVLAAALNAISDEVNMNI